MRLSGATTVTLQNPVASAVLTCGTPLVGAGGGVRFADAHAARVTLPGGGATVGK
ncbi:hypothetical protein Slala03_10170 [Streptomyces lavendulae subsp. lavendulae]|nr:hypothetical protein Slala03_10170 [Streptomyces lavendulae subsp. lavendulae]GLV99852.1 hypothetical protein Slala05_34840 [Streptomyces lavendulae subsp. lavendulae]GLX39536.1 hypothetical protein Sros01_56090 [Streptomyces roseochromogenus]